MPTARVGDLEIAYVTEGAGEAILLLPGLGSDHGTWRLERAELARRHRLVLVDPRDAGASAEASGPYGLADVAGDALGVMDALGIERFHVIGTSLGAAVTQHVALQAPTRVASMVLCGGWGRTDAFLRIVLETWRGLAGTLTEEALTAVRLPWLFTHRALESPPAAVLTEVPIADRSVAGFQRQIDACLEHDTLALLALLQTPTLVLVGEDDRLTPPRYARALVAALGRAELTLVAAGGHACHLETPKPVTERLVRFLARHPIVAS